MAHGMNPVELPCQPRGTQPRQVGGQSRGGGLLADADAENRCARALLQTYGVEEDGDAC